MSFLEGEHEPESCDLLNSVCVIDLAQSYSQITSLVKLSMSSVVWFLHDCWAFLSSSVQMRLRTKRRFFCSYVTDSVVAVTVCMFLFIIPARKPNYFCLWKPSGMAYACPKLACKLAVFSTLLFMRTSSTYWGFSVKLIVWSVCLMDVFPGWNSVKSVEDWCSM